MECGIALLSGTPWGGMLTWIAFAVVVTALVAFAAARRRPGPALSAAAWEEEIRRLSIRVEDISRRLESLERSGGR